MKRIHILVEGQTEETFVREILRPHLATMSLDITPIINSTKRAKTGKKYKGGITGYSLVRKQLQQLLRNSSVSMVTTMIDYYQLPDDFPGRSTLPRGSCYKRVEYLEEEFAVNINDARFLPFFTLHEFEALIFTDPTKIADSFPEQSIVKPLQDIRNRFDSPEEINDGPNTHPAARITRYAKGYQKTLHGPVIAQRIGLESIRRECPHFNAWLTHIESLSREE